MNKNNRHLIVAVFDVLKMPKIKTGGEMGVLRLLHEKSIRFD
jgi:hypothetical protein